MTGPEQEDEILWGRSRRGDRAAFARLAGRYWSPIHRLARNLVASQPLADEVAEATFLRALHAPESLPSGLPFRAALVRETLHACRRRTRMSGSRVPGSAGRGAPDGAGAAARLRSALDGMDELDRAAFLLREIEELSVQETSTVLELPIPEVRARVHRACLCAIAALAEPRPNYAPDQLH